MDISPSKKPSTESSPTLRGSGRTSEQIMALPLDSIFVVLNAASASYTQRLLEHLGRPDVRMITYENFKGSHYQLLLFPFGIGVDHSVWEELDRRGRHYEIEQLAAAVDQWIRVINHTKERMKEW